MSATENTQVTRRLLAVFEHGRLEEIDQLVHPEFVNHEAPPGSPRGADGLKQTISWLRGLWGPMRAQIEDEITEDDKVVARITMHGHHVGEFLGKPHRQGIRGQADPYLASQRRQGDRALVSPRRPRPSAPVRPDQPLS